jgi:hypothetical protein
VLVASGVLSPRVVQVCPGTCRLAFGAGILESRSRGRRGVFVADRQRTRGGDERFVSIAGDGLPSRRPRVHVPAFPDSDLPGVNSITENRTVYL